jgi:hypothetical protein
VHREKNRRSPPLQNGVEQQRFNSDCDERHGALLVDFFREVLPHPESVLNLLVLEVPINDQLPSLIDVSLESFDEWVLRKSLCR